MCVAFYSCLSPLPFIFGSAQLHIYQRLPRRETQLTHLGLHCGSMLAEVSSSSLLYSLGVGVTNLFLCLIIIKNWAEIGVVGNDSILWLQ